MDTRYFSDKVVKWYELNKRDLPWRETNDPYKIWLSEVILQQTRVNQGLPYYLRFVKKFPNVRALAAATEQDVLRLWQGLGYYTRARNLHKCAQEVVRLHDAVFPRTFESLKRLRGIGDYTAAAIASFCFKEHVAVVDGNVFRVLSRVFGVAADTKSHQGKKVFSELAHKLLGNDSDIYNQAIMEFGALCCTPKNPACHQCIFRKQCFAASHNMQALLPARAKPITIRRRYFYYFIVQKGAALLMKKREEKDIWHGMYDFPLVEKSGATSIRKVLEASKDVFPLNLDDANVTVSRAYKHVLTHQHIFAKFVFAREKKTKHKTNSHFKFYSTSKIGNLPKPALISRFLADHHLL